MKTLHLKTISALVTLTLFTLLHGAYQGLAANDDGRKIYYTLLKGSINNKLADDFEGVLKEAENVSAHIFDAAGPRCVVFFKKRVAPAYPGRVKAFRIRQRRGIDALL